MQGKRGFFISVSALIKILNLGHGGDMTKRKQHRFKGGKTIDVEEYHDGRYGAPGCKREKKKNPTKEQIQKINAWNKARRCRWKLLEYFSPGDCFATWTYEVKNRPPDMAGALKDFQKAMRSVRKNIRRRSGEAFYKKRSLRFLYRRRERNHRSGKKCGLRSSREEYL